MISFSESLPHDIEAEASALSAGLNDTQSLIDLIDLLDPDDFYSSINQKIFKVMKNTAPKTPAEQA